MYIKKSKVEYWVNHIVKDLQKTKAENDTVKLKHTYNHASGEITMLYLLNLITDEQWNKLRKQMLAIALE